MNKAKKAFIVWLKNNNANNVDIFSGEKESNDGWDYYCVVSGFIEDALYTVSFMVWSGSEKIDYSDEYNRYDGMSITEFIQTMDFKID
jgi:hypothetical protein